MYIHICIHLQCNQYVVRIWVLMKCRFIQQTMKINLICDSFAACSIPLFHPHQFFYTFIYRGWCVEIAIVMNFYGYRMVLLLTVSYLKFSFLMVYLMIKHWAFALCKSIKNRCCNKYPERMKFICVFVCIFPFCCLLSLSSR